MRRKAKLLTIVAVVAAVAADVAVVVLVAFAHAAVVVVDAVVKLALGPRSSAGHGTIFSIVKEFVFLWGIGFCCIRHSTRGCRSSGTSRRRPCC